MPSALLAAVLASIMSDPKPLPAQLRPPAIPLIAHDPYFSIWSPHEQLASADTEHWTQAPHHLGITVELDGKRFRLLGGANSDIAALTQTDLRVFPTRVVAKYQGMGVELILTFLSPSISTDLDLLSLPISYIQWDVRSTDRKNHTARVEITTNGMIAAARENQAMKSDVKQIAGMQFAHYGTAEQPILETKGDRTQIDWGTFYVGGESVQLDTINTTGKLAGDLKANLIFKPLSVGAKSKSQVAVVFYDDEYSIQYFHQNLRPYWRRNGETAHKILKQAIAKKSELEKLCEKFDQELVEDLELVGGSHFSQIAILSYRQCIAGSKLAADPNGQPLWFPKENSSNGCMATTDVIYPMSPQAFLFGPALTKALLEPVLAYGSSERWKFPFAPHDLGTYPLANGQVYGGGERTEENQMPVEESANMLIMMAALAKMEGNADYAQKYWPTLTKWANYLVQKGFNPENQLCTDDFLGHLAQNVNLSAKAIMGIRAYARLCELRGLNEDAIAYKTTAENFTKKWVREASDAESTRLTFDKVGSWSQKYNLVWDTLLDFDLFPPEVKRKEMDWYLKNCNEYGLPIDSRGSGAKLDWNIWIATLTQDQSDFNKIMAGVYRYVHETPQRVGLGDWYDTSTGNLNFFQHRPVMGGAFLPLLYREPIWQKWSKRSNSMARNWAKIPPPPVIRVVHPAADSAEQNWRFSFEKPDNSWSTPEYDDSHWLKGYSGFGTEGTP